MIIYAELAEVSIAELFIGGVIPGLIIASLLSAFIYFAAYKGGPPPSRRLSWRERGPAIRSAFLPMLSPIIAVGGIVSGAITPTEAGVILVLYALCLMVLYREQTAGEIITALREAALGTAMPLFIVTTALLFSWIVTVEQVPLLLVDLLGDIVDNWILTILLMNLVLLLLGTVLEGMGVLILMVPILKPIALDAGIDLVHMGVFMTVNLMIGMITPPIGLSLFVASEITKCSLTKMTRTVSPFLIPLVAGLLTISLIPETVTWLVDLTLH
jgi:tripartite ATP-independent transporter DctM subunit